MFGNCLEYLIEAIVAKPDELENERFRKVLALAADEWSDTAIKYNGGNSSSHNLRRSGKCIESIWHVCNVASPASDIAMWRMVLRDVSHISRIVRHELFFNTETIEPFPTFLHYHSGERVRYRRMSREDRDNPPEYE